MSESNYPSLILLSPPPDPVTASALRASYEPSIISALKTLSSLHLSRVSILELVVPQPALCGRLNVPRSMIFQEAERLLAGLYSLVCYICDQNAIELFGPGGIDPRILLLAHDISQRSSEVAEPLTPQALATGPIVDLHTYALTRRQWHFIFTVDSEQGQLFFKQYMSIARRGGGGGGAQVKGQIRTVEGGITMHYPIPIPTGPLQKSPPTSHTVVVVGGTFDNLHAGHKLLLTATALLLQPPTGLKASPGRLIVGITGDELLKTKKYAEYLGSWDRRQRDVVDFLKSILFFSQPRKESTFDDIESFDASAGRSRAVHTWIKSAMVIIECVEIHDPFGPTITDEAVTALVVSGETRDGGKSVNDKRAEKGWATLEIFEVEVLNAHEDGQAGAQEGSFATKISSTAIRKRKAENARGPSL